MGKGKGMRKESRPVLGFQLATLREETRGTNQIKGVKNVTNMLRLQHLQKLATWAAGEAAIPQLGAVFGHKLASGAEAMGVSLDPSVFQCKRCETVLQPGHNCTIRIEKTKTKTKRCKKSAPKNFVVYTCHYCSHRNLKRGTQKGYMRELLASCPKPVSESSSSTPKTVSEPKIKCSRKAPGENSPLTPFQKIEADLSNAKRKSSLDFPTFTPKAVSERKIKYPIKAPGENCSVTPLSKIEANLSGAERKSSLGPKKPINGDHGAGSAEPGNGTGKSRKRRRKGWSSFKEIAESVERENAKSIGNLSLPLFTS